MNAYSKNSDNRLNTCHPDLIIICRTLLKSFDHSVFQGHRGISQQNRFYDSGKSKVRYPNSKHNKIPAMAVDIAPYPREKNATNETNKYYLMAGHFLQIANDLYEKGTIDHKIRWGGDWNMNNSLSDNNFDDLGHFELFKD